MPTRTDEIFRLLGISENTQPGPAKTTSRQAEIENILSFMPSIRQKKQTAEFPQPAAPLKGELSGAENNGLTSDSDVGAALRGGPQNVSPAGETEPMGYGGGGTAGGGSGRGGRADERSTLQKKLNELDEAAVYVTTTEQSDEIERQRRPIIEQLRQMDAEEGKSGVYTGGDRLKNTGANAKLMVQQGLTIADHAIAQTADGLFGGIAKEGRALLNTTLQSINPDWGFENPDPLITQYNKRGEEVLSHNQTIADTRIEEGKLDPTVWKYGPQVVAAVPDAVLAVLTYGSSAAPQTTTKGLEAASRLAQGGKLYQKVAPLVQSTLDMMRSPQWLSAFARSAGPSYEAALADGTSEELATLYALANGYANATIEVGGGDEALGGIQKLPKQLQDLIRQGDSSKLLLWAKSTLSEAGEEVWQGLTEKGLRGIYTDEVPLYSKTDENAVLNPSRMKEEAKGGLVVGGILSGGQTTAQSFGTAIKAPAAQPGPAGNNVPLQQNIDNAAQQGYTEINEEMNGGNIGGSETGTGAETAEAYTRERAPGLPEGDRTVEIGRNDGPGNYGLAGYDISEDAKKALLQKGVVDVGVKNTDADGAFFASAMEQAAASQRFGASVDLKTAEKIAEIVAEGGHAFIAENGSGGVVVTGDGDIEGVFKNRRTGNASTFANLMICAIENGGVKLDCYGRGLVNRYERFGFIPVAQVNFDKDQVNERWNFETQGTPQIYFMLFSGNGAVDTIANMDTVHLSTQKELDALPEMDYDSAYAYRDRLLAERGGKGAPLGGAGTQSVTEGGTTAAANKVAKADPIAAARQQYQTEITAALRAGDYQRALKLFKEFGNPNLRALNEVQTLVSFEDFFQSAGLDETEMLKQFEEIYQKTGDKPYSNDRIEKTIADLLETDISQVYLGNIPEESKQVIYNGVERCIRKFPKIKEQLRSIVYDPSIKAVAKSRSLNGIIFVGKEFSDFEKLKKMYDYNVQHNFYAKGTNVNSIIIHEIGHQFDGLFSLNGIAGGGIGEFGIIRRSSTNIQKEILSRLGFTDEKMKAICQEYASKEYTGQELDRIVLLKQREYITQHVSEYASSNEREFFAELFSEYMTSDNPRKAAQIFGDIFKREYGGLD